HTLASNPRHDDSPPRPRVTAAVCTRDRAADLDRCLQALTTLAPAAHEILVVDNASRTDHTRRTAEAYSQVRYIYEPRPGLDWARNRAIGEATGDVIAFTDDDVIVDRRWVGALQQAFADR